MTEPFIGEVSLLGFGFAPRGQAVAAGQLLPINQNVALYSLLGVTFGGDGRTTFGLPNLASRQACGTGQSPGTARRTQGQTFGSFEVTLSQTQMPVHIHTLSAYRPATSAELAATPSTGTAIGHSGFGTFTPFAPTGSTGATGNFASGALSMEGAGQPHPNTQPYLGIIYTIALQGLYPQRP